MIIYVYWLSLHFGAWTTGRPHAVHAARDQSTLRWDGTSGGLCCHGRCHTDRSCSPGTSQPGQQGWWVSLGFQWFPDWFSRKIAFWVRKRIKLIESHKRLDSTQEFQRRCSFGMLWRLLLCQTFQLTESRTTYPTQIQLNEYVVWWGELSPEPRAWVDCVLRISSSRVFTVAIR